MMTYILNTRCFRHLHDTTNNTEDINDMSLKFTNKLILVSKIYKYRYLQIQYSLAIARPLTTIVAVLAMHLLIHGQITII